MKRALAERAKQEADDPVEVPHSETRIPTTTTTYASNTLASTTNTTATTNSITTTTIASTNEASPPSKIPKLEHTLSPHHRSTSLPNLTQSKRIRMPHRSNHQNDSNNDDGDDEESNSATQNAFYLKHQNKALASELYQYKHTIALLEKERTVRRQELQVVAKVIQELNQVWVGVEGTLIALLQQKYPMIQTESTTITTTIPQDTPSSTGEGTHLEKIHDIVTSIVQLSKVPFSTINGDDHHDHANENNDMKSSTTNSSSSSNLTYIQALSNTTQQYSKRCIQFQELLKEFIQLTTSTSTQNDPMTTDETMTNCYTQISNLQNTCSILQGQLEDMAKAKDEANESERRVRRGLYRVAAGRLKIGQVLQAVEKDGSSTLEDLEEIQGDVLSATNVSALDNTQIKTEHEGKDGSSSADAIVLDGKVVSSSDVILMKKKIDDLELVNTDREKRIHELLNEKEDHERRVNELLSQQKVSSRSNSDVASSPQFVELSSKLAAAGKEIENFKIDLKSVQDRWAITKGDLELARKSVSELEMKHRRRLRELLGVSGDDTGGEEEGEEVPIEEAYFDQAKTVMELEHKLKHALDNVRQAESIRKMLGDAHALNEMLKQEIRDLKTRNEELSTSKTNDDDLSFDTDDVDMTDKESRRLRKELEVAISSKSQAKDRLEQAIKERDVLFDMNQRLQQQCVEKDDMNAKSLSSILHLKQLSEQLEQEKVKMEISLKSAQQLALTARLAANAKIRVEEEATKEKEIAQAELKQMKEAFESLQNEKNAIEAELAACKAMIDEAKVESGVIRKRCDDLVTAATASEKERKQLEEALVIAKKDAAEAAQKVAMVQANARGGSGDKFDTEFTKEELTILVNDLKSRLACPVCNTREKKVINTRCRHMFCRQCVDKSLENRNRKCPSCGIRFDKKDIEDVWF